ncbi:MAG: histidine--tRNA ligase [Rhodospirillales bacterium]|nr:histidine--tRNA ligase [Rhodospirillales bacterium]
MSEKKQIHKPAPISGFPEWLPETRLVEQQWFDHIRKVFESYGFCNIETPSVEALDVLRAKGEVDKEIYVLERLHKDEGDDSEARLALHFDQTVPLARYVAQHFNDLTFPFKRYQMQRVWRGERPQAGRFREFYQCDIDVINVDGLPLSFDAEMPAVMWEILSSLPGMESENIQMRISNRKILMGYLDGCDLDKDLHPEVLRTVDKLEKIGEDAVKSILIDELSMIEPEALQILAFAKCKLTPQNINSEISQFVVGEEGSLLQEGIDELTYVMNQLSHLPEGAVVADLSIVRGLDYYTGTVYETVFVDDPGYGSICSGGRFDDLASSYINKALPGVGISIGFSRLFARLEAQGKLPTGAKSPAQIMMVLPNEEQRAVAAEAARTLRSRGYNVELYHAPQKLKKQLAYAEKKGIPYVWFPPFEAGADHEVKCMNTHEQTKADPREWTV